MVRSFPSRLAQQSLSSCPLLRHHGHVTSFFRGRGVDACCIAASALAESVKEWVACSSLTLRSRSCRMARQTLETVRGLAADAAAVWVCLNTVQDGGREARMKTALTVSGSWQLTASSRVK
jgi:hypothetical protein